MNQEWGEISKNGWIYQNDEAKLIRYFIDITNKYRNSARAKFELANVYDFLGQEIKAIPLYEEAIHLGLNDEWEAYAFLQLGSSLKNIGNLNDAISVLSTAEKRFPHLPSISMFLAITLHYADMDSEGIEDSYESDTTPSKNF